MQEVKPTNAEEKTVLAEENDAAAADSEAAAPQLLDKMTSPEKEVSKIECIRNALGEISRKEEEEEISARIIENVKVARDRKENPEKYAAEEKARAEALARRNRQRRRRPVRRKKRTPAGGVIPRKGDTPSELLRKGIFWLSVCVFIGCIIWMCTELVSRYQTKQKYDDITNQYNSSSQTKVTTKPKTTTATNSGSSEEIPTEEATYELLPGAANLLEMSKDVVGYITIPGTVVNYPIMQNTEDDEGEEYFLHHDFYGNNSNLGSIFLDFRCSFDMVGEDKKLAVPNSDNLIVYGHNMNDESMFGSLRRYRSDENYYEQHPLIEVNSNYETYTFKIYGYFIADAVDNTDTRFEYWNYIDFTGEEGFYEYVNEVKRRTLRLTDVDVEYGDQLLTLSTCSEVVSNGRLVVCARALREGEDPYEGVTGSKPNPNIKWPTIHRNSSAYDPDDFVPYG
jgi:sortase B